MKKITLLLMLLASLMLKAQVGVNTNTPNGMLDVTSSTNGFLLPRVALTATNVATPVVNPQGGALVESTLVYNTATVAGVNGVSPGYYYWNGSRWITFTGNSSRDWSLNGNSGITSPAIPGTYGTSLMGATENYLGTTDANDVVFGTNGIERMRLKQSSGNVGIGTANPSYKLDIVAPGNNIGMRLLSGNNAELSYISLGRTYEYAQIGATTAGTFFTDAQAGDMAIKNFNTGKLLLGASYIDTADMAIVPGGFIGINNSSPATLFDIRGINNWDTNATEGDFRIGDATYRLKIGVALGGAGAGDIRITAQGGTNRIFMGNATNNLLFTIDGLNNRIGVKNVILPNSVLDVAGDLALREGPALVLPNSAFPSVTLTAGSEFSHYRITGPAMPFTIQTISGGNDGQVITLLNHTGQLMSVAHNNTANGILTGTGNGLVGTDVAISSVTLIYNAFLARWVLISSTGMSENRDWRITGNTGTNDPSVPVNYGITSILAGENYIGTTDANDVVLASNGMERMRIKQTTGNIGIGTATPSQLFHAYKNSNTSKTVIFGEASQASTATDYQNIGVQGYGRGGNSAWGYGIGVLGMGDSPNSYYATGVYANLGSTVPTSPTSDQALYANGNSIGYSGIFTGGNVGIGSLNPTRAVLQTQGAVGNTVATFNQSTNSIGISLVSDWPGVYFNSYYDTGVRQMSNINYPAMLNYNPGGQFEFTLGNTANTVAGNLVAGGSTNTRFVVHRDTGAYFAYNNTTVTGLAVSSGGLWPDLGWFSTSITASLNNGRGVSAAGENIGIEGRANHNNTATTDKLGGVFYVTGYNGTASWGFPAAATVGAVVDNTVYKVFGFGAVSTIVKDTEEKDRIMVAPESPEALFQDYGIGQLVNGYAKIQIDPILAKNIRVDETHPLKIFVQLEGDCNGVYVYNKTAESFEVKELHNGTSNTPFSYQIVGYRADEERAGITSKYSDMRFKPLKVQFKETIQKREESHFEQHMNSEVIPDKQPEPARR